MLQINRLTERRATQMTPKRKSIWSIESCAVHRMWRAARLIGLALAVPAFCLATTVFNSGEPGTSESLNPGGPNQNTYVTGWTDSAFENNVSISAVLEDGTGGTITHI
jgi:hypothetical protein